MGYFNLKYTPQMFGEEVVALMKDGKSIAEVARELKVPYSTLEGWRHKFPEIKEAVEQGQLLSKGWWEEQGRENLKNKSFNFVGWYMQMKNRHNYNDRKAVYPTRTIPGFAQMSIINQMKSIDELLAEGKISADEYHMFLNAIKIKMEILFDSEMAEQHREMYEEFILKREKQE